MSSRQHGIHVMSSSIRDRLGLENTGTKSTTVTSDPPSGKIVAKSFLSVSVRPWNPPPLPDAASRARRGRPETR